jgi:hypothetical protein
MPGKNNYIFSIREMLRRQPFQPFAIRLSDGRAFDIAHPDFLFVTPKASLVHYVSEDDRSQFINPDQIVSCEVFNQPPRARKRSA